MRYIYPAVFHPFEDGSKGYMVTFPDIPSCMTEGYSLEEAVYMAQDALYQMLSYYEETGKSPDNPPSKLKDIPVSAEKGEFVNLIIAETKDQTQIQKTVHLPKWMVEQALARHINLSKTLEFALAERLQA